jgi:thiamine biosynthesis lipoprotein
VQCDDETGALLQSADELYQHSAGLFDLTSGVLRQAWDFRQPRLPDRPG